MKTVNNRPTPFSGIRHIALIVPNIEACVTFYTEIMGMNILRRANKNLVYLTNGNDNLSLNQALTNEPIGLQSLDHFGFIVDEKSDLEEWFQFMDSQGVPLLDVPHDHSDGARSFHCKDPAGNVLQPLYHPEISGQQFS